MIIITPIESNNNHHDKVIIIIVKIYYMFILTLFIKLILNKADNFPWTSLVKGYHILK